MSDRTLTFKLVAADEASAVIAKNKRALADLRAEDSRRSGVGFFGRLGEDLKKARKSPTAEGFEEIGKLARGAGAIAVAVEAMHAFADATKEADAAVEKLGRGVKDGAFLESLANKIGGRFIVHDLLGNDQLADTAKQLELQKDLIKERIKAADALHALEADLKASQPGLPDVDKGEIGIGKNLVAQVNALHEATLAAEEAKQQIDNSGLFDFSREAGNMVDSFIDGTIGVYKKSQDVARGIADNQREELRQAAKDDRARRITQSDLDIEHARGEIRRADLRAEGEALTAELDMIQESKDAKVEAIRLEALATAKGKTDEEKAEIYAAARQKKRLAEQLQVSQEIEARVDASKDSAQKADEEYAKELDDEDAQRQRFKPSKVGAFQGEARLITGAVGAAATDPTVEPINRTAKNSDKQARLAELVESHLKDIRDALTKSGAGPTVIR